MNTSYDKVLDMLINQLDLLNVALDKLSNFTNKEIRDIKLDLQKLTDEMKAFREQPCPKNEKAILEIINVATLKANAKKPDKNKKTALWIFGISGGIITLIKAIYEFIDFINI